MALCGICSRENVEEIESSGEECLRGDRSWRSAAEQFGLAHQSLKVHMDKHYVSRQAAETQSLVAGYAELTNLSIEELMRAAEFAPVEVKPFYLVAIQNLEGLKETKPSQQHLINALKAIHEVTGMKLEQRLMLDFAGRMFGAAPAEAIASIEEHAGIIDADVVEE